LSGLKATAATGASGPIFKLRSSLPDALPNKPGGGVALVGNAGLRFTPATASGAASGCLPSFAPLSIQRLTRSIVSLGNGGASSGMRRFASE
jgi:hypothetical protein